MNNTWFRRFTTGPAANGPLLVCFPHAGGSATAFKDLARTLHPAVDVVAVQYPGRQDRYSEAPFTDLGRLAEVVAGELAGVLTANRERPYALFGHSMGTLVAFETARHLVRAGRPGPRRLFLSGRGDPVTGYVPYHLWDDDKVLDDVRRLGGTNQAMLENPDLMELVLPALRADYRALGMYHWQAGAPLTAPVTVLIGADDPMVTVEEAGTWQAHTTGDFQVQVFPGDHFYLFDQVEQVAAAVTGGLLTGAAAA